MIPTSASMVDGKGRSRVSLTPPPPETAPAVRGTASGSGLAILIACLGLLGLAAFTAQQRTKEIGIRKALGATAAGIVRLLSKDFLKLVGVAFIIAVPVAYWAMSQWLQGFAYRIDLGAGVFLFAGVLALVVALTTVGTQAWRAARTDPATALHSE